MNARRAHTHAHTYTRTHIGVRYLESDTHLLNNILCFWKAKAVLGRSPVLLLIVGHSGLLLVITALYFIKISKSEEFFYN